MKIFIASIVEFITDSFQCSLCNINSNNATNLFMVIIITQEDHFQLSSQNVIEVI